MWKLHRRTRSATRDDRMIFGMSGWSRALFDSIIPSARANPPLCRGRDQHRGERAVLDEMVRRILGRARQPDRGACGHAGWSQLHALRPTHRGQAKGTAGALSKRGRPVDRGALAHDLFPAPHHWASSAPKLHRIFLNKGARHLSLSYRVAFQVLCYRPVDPPDRP